MAFPTQSSDYWFRQSTASVDDRFSQHLLSYSTSPGRLVPDNDSWDVDETDKFLRSFRRAGGPYLCSIPTYTTPLPREYRHRLRLKQESGRLIQEVGQVLEEEGLAYREISIIGRQSKFNSQPQATPTIFIIALERVTDTDKDWRDVTRRVYRHVASEFRGISVEIIDKLENDPAQCWAVGKHPISTKGKELSHAVLRSFDMSTFTSLSCSRYGRHEDSPVAIVATVDYSKEGRFKTENLRIQVILLGFGENDVSVIIFKSRYWRFNYSALEEQAMRQRALSGVSMRAYDSTANSSTFGGMVELLFEDEDGEEWEPYTLTCFHCICPLEQHREQLYKIPGAQQAFKHYSGIAPELLCVNQPSVPNLKAMIASLDKWIKGKKTAKYEDLKMRIEAGSCEYPVMD